MYGVPAAPTCVTVYTPLFACVTSFLTKMRLLTTVSVESTDRAPLALAVSVAPTPDVPLLYVFAGRAAVVAKSTASWKWMPEAIASAYCLLTMSVLLVGVVEIVPDVRFAVVMLAVVALIVLNSYCTKTLPALSSQTARSDG